jgi:hypothetical protein
MALDFHPYIFSFPNRAVFSLLFYSWRACPSHPQMSRMQGKEPAMIELTEQQAHALVVSGDTPPVVVDPTTKTAYVLLRQEVYERLTGEEYDDGPWTDEELALLAAEAGEMLDAFGKDA